MRLLVHEPMKTRSIRALGDRLAGLEAHVVEHAPRPASALALVEVGRVGDDGRRSATTSSGLVPQVTIGVSVETSISTSRSKRASGSEKKVFQ